MNREVYLIANTRKKTNHEATQSYKVEKHNSRRNKQNNVVRTKK